jgi:hypothetical protein
MTAITTSAALSFMSILHNPVGSGALDMRFDLVVKDV